MGTSSCKMDFPVKSVKWLIYEQVTPILLQVSNGPCPLIALVNTLLLKEDILQRLEKSQDSTDLGNLRRLLQRHVGSVVLSTEVIASLGDVLLAMPDLNQTVLDQLLDSLPLLHTGLDVNPNLVTGRFQETDLAAQVFSAFGLEFVHGWCKGEVTGENESSESAGQTQAMITDEELPTVGSSKLLENDSNVDAVFQECQDYNSLQDYLLRHENSNVLVQIQKWLGENSTQLTSYGLSLMHQRILPETALVFFRNNHFSTLYKDNDSFYVLITDGSFDRSADYVWQSLTGISGGTDLFFSGDFSPISETTDVPHERYEQGTADLLVQQLQEEEDSNYAALLQKQYDRKGKRGQNKKSEKSEPEPKKPESKQGSRAESGSGKGSKKKPVSTTGKEGRLQKLKSDCSIV